MICRKLGVMLAVASTSACGRLGFEQHSRRGTMVGLADDTEHVAFSLFVKRGTVAAAGVP